MRALSTESEQKMVATRAQLRNGVIWDRVESVQGVFVEILSRLSVRSIRSFKKVNKYWYGSISNKFFAKKQLAHSRENPSYIACPIMDSTMKLYSMKPGSFKLSYLNTIDPSERSEKEYMYMIASFNGLICCINNIYDEDEESKFYDLQIWISNPCTGETLLLPQGRPSFDFEPSVGVAYGPDISDYKVFRIFCAGKKIPEERVSQEIYYIDGQMHRKYRYAHVYECEVYSSRTGYWKNIGPVPCVPMHSYYSPFRSCHICVRGKIYWLSSLDEPAAILSVDLEGRFSVIELPEYSDDLKEEDRITDATFLINLRDSLSVVIIHAYYMDIWVWKEDSKQSGSWVFECGDSIAFDDFDLVLGMTSLKNQILCMTERHWYYYDVDTGIWKKRKANKAGFVNPAVFPFTESLLPCNGGVMVHREQ